MDLGFAEIVNDIDRNIELKYLPGCIRWADETHAGAWSKAIDNFERAINQFQKDKDVTSVMREGEIYKATCLRLIAGYKKHLGDAKVAEILKQQREAKWKNPSG